MLPLDLLTKIDAAVNESISSSYEGLDKDSFISRLKTSGVNLSKLGNGCFATVYKIDDLPYVLKVSGGDAAASAYLKMCYERCLKRKRESWMPEVHYLHTDNHYLVAVMPQYILPSTNDVDELFSDKRYKSKKASKALEVGTRTYHMIHNLMHNGMYEDIHAKNIMIDPVTNTLIITDPIAGGNTL